MKSDIGHNTNKINILPYDYEYEWTGRQKKTLDVNRTLIMGKYIFEDEHKSY